MRWDLFCRVIDNFGDIGVCWRLGADLAARGDAVRLWVDDARALAWMAPGGHPGVAVCDWAACDATFEPADAVVEAFGCDPPAAFVESMARRPVPPVWINLEYLSAEPYVERSHTLLSPQPGGLRKWFFYPGFTARTGGLLREPGLMAERERFDRAAWLAAQGVAWRPDEQVLSLFAYPDAPVETLLERLAGAPTLLLLTAGMADVAERPGLRVHRLPWLSQIDFDRLLWSADLNFVRGEDSVVRAMWAGSPFVWQIYAQHDGVHGRKLEALLDRLPVDDGVRALWRAWNGLGPWPAAWPDARRWAQAGLDWRRQLLTQDDLGSQLRAFVAAAR